MQKISTPSLDPFLARPKFSNSSNPQLKIGWPSEALTDPIDQLIGPPLVLHHMHVYFKCRPEVMKKPPGGPKRQFPIFLFSYVRGTTLIKLRVVY